MNPEIEQIKHYSSLNTDVSSPIIEQKYDNFSFPQLDDGQICDMVSQSVKNIKVQCTKYQCIKLVISLKQNLRKMSLKLDSKQKFIKNIQKKISQLSQKIQNLNKQINYKNKQIIKYQLQNQKLKRKSIQLRSKTHRNNITLDGNIFKQQHPQQVNQRYYQQQIQILNNQNINNQKQQSIHQLLPLFKTFEIQKTKEKQQICQRQRQVNDNQQNNITISLGNSNLTCESQKITIDDSTLFNQKTKIVKKSHNQFKQPKNNQFKNLINQKNKKFWGYQINQSIKTIQHKLNQSVNKSQTQSKIVNPKLIQKNIIPCEKKSQRSQNLMPASVKYDRNSNASQIRIDLGEQDSIQDNSLHYFNYLKEAVVQQKSKLPESQYKLPKKSHQRSSKNQKIQQTSSQICQDSLADSYQLNQKISSKKLVGTQNFEYRIKTIEVKSITKTWDHSKQKNQFKRTILNDQTEDKVNKSLLKNKRVRFKIQEIKKLVKKEAKIKV